MNRILVFGLFGLAALLPVACNEEPEVEELPAAICIEPVITRANEVNFETGDVIGLDVIKADGGIHASNQALTYDGSAFTGDLEWYSDGGMTSSLKAYYPYGEGGFPEAFTVGSDQRSGAGAWDLMLSTKENVSPQAAPVAMVFRHQLSQIVMNVENSAGVTLQEVTLKGLYTTLHFSTDPDSGEPVGSIDAADSKSDIIMEAVNPGVKYRAIVVPQTMAFGVSVRTASGSSVVQDFTEVTMKPGYSYAINATVTPEGVSFSLSGEIRAWEDGGSIEPGTTPGGDETSYEDFGDGFKYFGKEYRTVTLPDGSRWMAEPLAYLPAGITASDDPADGQVWYPYSSDGTSATVLKDEDSIKEFGYLYSYDALIGTALTGENYDKFEGAQGICPKGWHIPTRDDWFALCGYSNKSSYLEETGPKEDPSALFWDTAAGYATIEAFNEGGFNFTMSGCIANNKYSTLVADSSVCSDEGLLGRPRMTYAACSSPNSETNFFALMTTFTSTYPKGRVSLSFAMLGKVGVQGRCVKD